MHRRRDRRPRSEDHSRQCRRRERKERPIKNLKTKVLEAAGVDHVRRGRRPKPTWLASAPTPDRGSVASEGWWLARCSSESSGMPTFALCATVGRLRESRERSLEAAGVGLPRSSNSRMISRTRWSQLARNDRKPWCKYKTSTADPPASARIRTPRSYETGTCLPTHRSKRSR